MAPASNEEQFKFLISCIRYSNNGKVDFGQVASECKIVSKGAAAKRYERMMRAHGIASTVSPTVKTTPSRTPKNEAALERHTSSSTKPSPKKRKADQFVEDNTNADDEEGFGNPNVKSDPADTKEHLHVKEEDGALSLDEATNLMQFYDPSPYTNTQFGGEHSFGVNDYDGSAGGYQTPLGGSYGLASHQPFDFSPAVPRSLVPGQGMQALQYTSPYQYSTDNQGGSDSPVVVE